ncbi:MAG: hypothetical protein ACFNX8_02750, partial [Lancefieldella rimae]
FEVTRSAVIFIIREVPAPFAHATRILAFIENSFCPFCRNAVKNVLSWQAARGDTSYTAPRY